MLGLAVDQEHMESLQEDVIDLQGMVVTVFSQAGAVRYPSWKFPDKASCDLDLVPLLEHYGFAEDDPELTTCSHIVLLELIVDRLLLLLQSFTAYAGRLVHEEATSPSSATTGPSMSIGMAARTYWESMVKLGALYQQLAKEKKGLQGGAPNPPQASWTEDMRMKSSCSKRSESDVTILGPQASSLASSACSGLLHGDRTDRSDAKSTPGPSPAPCDTCEKAQLSLREASHAIVGICASQNLPSSLGRFLGTLGETLEHRPLNAMDISYWASEQNKDLSRIRKHLRTLTELIGPLKEELEASQEQEEEMRRRILAFENRLQKEKEEQRKQAGLLFEQRHREILQTVAQLEKEKEDLQDKAAFLEETVSTLKEKLQSQGATIQVLEQAKGDLLQEMHTKMVDKAEVESREERLEVLTGQLEAIKRQLGLVTMELDKEKAKVESVLRHKECLQAKQRALTQHLDHLDQECERLRVGLADSEEAHVLMKETMKEMQEGRQQTHRRLEEQQRLTEKAEQEKLRMEQCASELRRTISELGELVRETKKRERLLVLYPDLHVPVETHFEGTGDVMEDMGKQLRANNIRISILEEENARLRAILAKMEEAALLPEEAKIMPPTQLWFASDADDLYENGGLRSPMGDPMVAGIQGVAMRHPPRHANAGITVQSGHSAVSSIAATTATSQRTLGNPSAKPSSREAAYKPPPFAFVYEDAFYARAREQPKGHARTAHCTQDRRK